MKKKLRIGIMGGRFNPPHLGHINSLLTVHKKFLLDWIYVVPVFKPPLSRSITETTPLHRIDMLKAAFKDHPFVKMNESEIRRKGISYSYMTVEEIAEQWKEAELFLILGQDQFQIWDQWKNTARILIKSHLIVTSRPGGRGPLSKDNLPESLKKEVSSFSKKLITLKNKKNIYFSQLKDKNISSTLVRERLKNGLSVHSLIPSSVSDYIHEKDLYNSVTSFQPTRKQNEKTSLSAFINQKTPVYKASSELRTIKEMIRLCCKALKSKKAFNIKLYDFSHISGRPFYFALIASGLHPPHSRTLVQYLEKQIKESFSLVPLGKEGEEEGQWIAMDYNTLGVHIFYDYSRGKYGFDEIWSDFLAVSQK